MTSYAMHRIIVGRGIIEEKGELHVINAKDISEAMVKFGHLFINEEGLQNLSDDGYDINETAMWVDYFKREMDEVITDVYELGFDDKKFRPLWKNITKEALLIGE